MKRVPHCLLFLTLCLSVALSTSAQDDAATAAVKFQISFAGGKTVYRAGEPVRLVLSYAATEPGYLVETYYSPLFDDVILSPTEGVYPWLDRLNRLYSYDDVSMSRKLSDSPVNVEITLNNLVRFDKPGRYRVKVRSKRVWKSQGGHSFRSNQTPLLSNEIEFEVREMSRAEEEAEVKRITALMDSAKTLHQHGEYKRELDYLTGDVSTVEKVNRFLNPPKFGGVYWLDTGVGLNIARNKELAVGLLEAALRDPDREIKEDLVGRLVTLRLLMEDERQPSRAANSEQLWKERAPRASELTRAYYAELLESLPKRAGRSRTTAAYHILAALPKDATSSAAYQTTRALLLEKFDELRHYEQSRLLDYYWDKIKTPALVPSLEKILSNKEPEPNWSNRANALKRLIELDQKRARPFVVGEVSAPRSSISPDILKTLDDEFLPEADGALLEEIRKLAPTGDHWLQQKLLLASRYATGKIYKELLEVYKTHGVHWRDEAGGPLLAYLLRHNEKEAVPLVEKRLADRGEKSGFYVFFNLTRMDFPRGLEKILRERVAGDDPEVVGTSAYYLSKYPTEENRRLVEKRYERWLKEWSARTAELDDPGASAYLKRQAMAQVELLGVLVRSEGWKKPAEEEVRRLKSTCVTRVCRQNLGIR